VDDWEVGVLPGHCMGSKEDGLVDLVEKQVGTLLVSAHSNLGATRCSPFTTTIWDWRRRRRHDQRIDKDCSDEFRSHCCLRSLRI
jgi:hypothetical protein